MANHNEVASVAPIDDKDRAELIKDCAAKLAAGEQLYPWQTAIVLAALQNEAQRLIAHTPTAPVGQPPKIESDRIVIIEYASMMTSHGYSKTKAVQLLALQFDVSEQAIKKRLGMVSSSTQQKRKEATGKMLRFFNSFDKT